MVIKLETSKIYGNLVNLKLVLDRAAQDSTIERSVNYAVDNIALDLQKRVQAKLKQKGPHKGGVYSYYRYKPYWTPAKPGEPPARITSRLYQSIYVDRSGQNIEGAGMIRRGGEMTTYRVGSGGVRSRSARSYSISVQTNLDYADLQEQGSSDGRIPARPFMGPAFQELYNDGRWKDHMEQAVVGAIKATTGFNVIPRWTRGEGGLDMRRSGGGQLRRAAQQGVKSGRIKVGSVERAKKKSSLSPTDIQRILDSYFPEG